MMLNSMQASHVVSTALANMTASAQVMPSLRTSPLQLAPGVSCGNTKIDMPTGQASFCINSSQPTHYKPQEQDCMLASPASSQQQQHLLLMAMLQTAGASIPSEPTLAGDPANNLIGFNPLATEGSTCPNSLVMSGHLSQAMSPIPCPQLFSPHTSFTDALLRSAAMMIPQQVPYLLMGTSPSSAASGDEQQQQQQTSRLPGGHHILYEQAALNAAAAAATFNTTTGPSEGHFYSDCTDGQTPAFWPPHVLQTASDTAAAAATGNILSRPVLGPAWTVSSPGLTSASQCAGSGFPDGSFVMPSLDDYARLVSASVRKQHDSVASPGRAKMFPEKVFIQAIS